MFLLVPILLFSALLWQDTVVAPDLRLEYFSFASDGGLTLSGLLVRPAGDAGPLPGVLVVHDFGGKKEDMHRLTLEFARRDFVALAIDLRGHGMSAGTSTFMQPGAESHDVLQGLAYLRGLGTVDGDRLAMVGYGMGGTAVLQAAAHAGGQVNATVVWAAPVDLVALFEERPEALLDLAGRRAVSPSVLEPAGLFERSPLHGLAQVRNGSALFVSGGRDALIPPDQAETGVALTPGAQLAYYEGLDHSLSSVAVDEQTLGFVELRTKGRVSPALDAAYPYVERDAGLLQQALTAMTLPVAWLAWERWCTRSPQRIKLYNYPADRTRATAGAFAAADVGVFVAVAYLAGSISQAGPSGVLAGIVPSPTSFGALAAAAAALALSGLGLADLERRLRGRDESRFEEAENLRRSLLVAATIVPVLLTATLLPSLMAQGNAWPSSLGFLLALGVFFLFTLGFEAFLRLRVQRRLRGVVDTLFGDHGLRNSVGQVAVGTLLYFAMMSAAVAFLFDAWPTGALPTALAMTLAVGLLSSVLYDRTRNVLAGAAYSALWLAWVANGALHF